MAYRRAVSFSDLMFNAASMILACGCAFFAGMMFVRLERGENLLASGPAPGERAMAADPLITGSTAQPADSPTMSRAAGIRLLAVVDGLALIEISQAGERRVWPVGEGGKVPGVGQILKIDRVDGRWQVTTTDMTIAADDQ